MSPSRPGRYALILAAAASAAMAAGAAAAADAPFHDLRGQAPIHGDAAAGASKASVCTACHGSDGMAAVPAFPNLAGQSATYLYVQLHGFKSGARSNAVMAPLAGSLSDRDMRDLAAHYAALPDSRPASDAARVPARGYTLFHDGDPALGVPPCQGCHGRAGRGPQPDPASTAPQPPRASFPALAGQNSQYLLEQLKAFRDGTRAGTSNARIMQGVTRNLGVADMQAVADYVSTLQPRGEPSGH